MAQAVKEQRKAEAKKDAAPQAADILAVQMGQKSLEAAAAELKEREEAKEKEKAEKKKEARKKSKNKRKLTKTEFNNWKMDKTSGKGDGRGSDGQSSAIQFKKKKKRKKKSEYDWAVPPGTYGSLWNYMRPSSAWGWAGNGSAQQSR